MKQIFLLLLLFMFSRSLVESPKDAKVYYQSAIKKIDNKDYKNALKDLNKSIQIDSKYYDALCTRAWLKVKMDSLQSSLNDFALALSIKENANLYYQKAHVELTLKDSIGACKDFNSACDLGYNAACDFRTINCR